MTDNSGIKARQKDRFFYLSKKNIQLGYVIGTRSELQTHGVRYQKMLPAGSCGDKEAENDPQFLWVGGHRRIPFSRLLGNNHSLLPDTDEENESFENKEDDFYGEDEIDICD